MSFLREVKKEILYTEKEDLMCTISEIHGLLNQSFKIHVSKNISLTIIKENIDYIRRFCFLIEKYIKEDYEIKVIKNKNNIKREYIYIIYFPDASSFLNKIKMLEGNKFIFNSKDILQKKRHKASYLIGEFFYCGIFSDPNKNYHLEFRKNDIASANKLVEILNFFGLNAKSIKRKNYYIVYLKEADKISDFLKIIGAYNSVLNLESLIVLKDIKNNINRKQNCELANLTKTISASVKQNNDIAFIFEQYGENYLSKDLRQIAEIRLNYPELSLIEMGKLHKPPISKSSVNYKLKKISKIAYNLKGESTYEKKSNS